MRGHHSSGSSGRSRVPGYPAGGRNYVYVGDVAVATVNALAQGRVGESSILGHQNLSYREAFGLLARLMDVRPRTGRYPLSWPGCWGRPATFRQVLDSNVYGSVYPLKAALPHLLKMRGSVTFISSISALNGMPSGSAYCAGKAAVANLAHTLRLELAGTGLHFGIVPIGFTQNDPEKRVLDAAGRPVPIAHRPPRWQKSQAVAHLILRHIRRRRRTVISALGRIIVLVHTYWPRLGD